MRRLAPRRSRSRIFRWDSNRCCLGMGLLELLLTLGLAMVLLVTLLQAVLVQGRGNERIVRLMRERGVQRRTLNLLRSEVLRADRIELGVSRLITPACSLAGRRPVLLLQTAEGTISYSLGAAPSSIWRGQVLMRCGPAYGLDGQPSAGASQNRVVLDALASGGFEATRSGPARLHLKLLQRFQLVDGSSQTIGSGLEMVTAEAPL